jgi:hypothetical protein
VGSRNRRTEAIFQKLEERGDKDPADLLSEIVSNPQEPKELRVQAANYLLPYRYGKCGTLPQARYISEPVDLPRATTLEQANANISFLSELKALGHIDLDFADSLIADNRTIAHNLIAQEELKLKVHAQGGEREQIIRIEGGLPVMPGLEKVIMPRETTPLINGNAPGPLIDAQPATEPTVDPPET